MLEQPKTLEEVKKYAVGSWGSLTVELRPTEDRTGSGIITPTYLKRHFTYKEDDKFTGVIYMYADNCGQAPLMDFEFKGSLNWGDPHPVAEGAWNIDYVLTDGFAVTPNHPQAAEMLNQGRPDNIEPFEVDKKTDFLKKAFPLFNLSEGQIATDYDLIFFSHGLLFMGAKHVDGTPFDKPERRPHQLQIPLKRL
ncbi:MAG: hypothetical protein AAGA80_05770 [Cyanobacteria bacterium P01_F01_bin.143]